VTVIQLYQPDRSYDLTGGRVLSTLSVCAEFIAKVAKHGFNVKIAVVSFSYLALALV
jgi:hypothetical protein